MSLVLELPVELETELRQAAAARGVAVEDFAVERLRDNGGAARRAQIERALAEGRTRLAPLFPEADPVASFLAEKHVEAARESARDFGA